MAVNISDTKHFKKGEKLPDGTTAKRGVVWNTKTNKRVTGKVVMSASGQGGMGATKSYKAGRSVSSMKRAAAKKNAAASRPRTKTGSGSSPSSGSPTPTPKPKREMSAAAKRAKQTRTGRRVADTAGRAGMTMAREKSGMSSSGPRQSSQASNKTPSNLTGFSGNKPGSIGRRGGFGGMQSAKPASQGGPKKGDVKQSIVGPSIYDGSRWVRAVKRNGKWVAA